MKRNLRTLDTDTHKVTIRLDAQQRKTIEELAKTEGKTLSSYLRDLATGKAHAFSLLDIKNHISNLEEQVLVLQNLITEGYKATLVRLPDPQETEEEKQLTAQKVRKLVELIQKNARNGRE